MGLPRASPMTLDSPLTAPPDLPVYAFAPEINEVTAPTTLPAVDVTGGEIASAMLMSENRGKETRALQRRAENDFAQHKKTNTGAKFKIKTDAAGNIFTNKLRVTSVVNQLMKKFVDIAQIHYVDNDPKFALVEDIVRDEFEFDPPLKDGWFPTYMRKKMEKSRSIFRKHWEEKGTRHPDCEENKHSALTAWWTSPAGINSSGRMKTMNAEKKTKRLSLTYGGMQGATAVVSNLPSMLQVSANLLITEVIVSF